MPKAMEEALRKAGEKKGYAGKRLEDFIYGILTNRMKKQGKDVHGRPLK